MNTFALGNFGYNTARTATRQMSRTSQPVLQFGSKADEVRLMLSCVGPENLFKSLCDPTIWSGKDVQGKDCSLQVVHFLEETLEKGAKSVGAFMQGLNPTLEGIQTLLISLDSLKKAEFVGQFDDGSCLLTRKGVAALKKVYPDLKLPEIGYFYNEFPGSQYRGAI